MGNVCYEGLINNPCPIDPFNVNDPNYEHYKEIFKDLQGGIIKNYGRNYSLYIFIQFNQTKVNEIKQWLRDEIACSVTSTWKQLCNTKAYKEEIKRRKQQKLDRSMHFGELCTNFFLSYAGYKILGLDPANPKNGGAKIGDPSFTKGMRHDWERRYRLASPPPSAYWYNPPECWDIGGGNEEKQRSNVPQECSNVSTSVHALVLLAHDDLEQLKNTASGIISKFEGNTTIDRYERIGKAIACEAGYVLRDPNSCKTIGPFGFADGLSQPLFLKSDYDKYWKSQDIKQWDPKASLNLVLLKDPFGEPYSYGSYCVFQKIETNQDLFEQQISGLAAKLECDRDRAGALVIGRFKDGTPIALQSQPNPTSESSTSNSFNYADDSSGNKCPIQAHIRKTNPRHDNPVHDGPSQTEERKTKNRIFRAGITYFDVKSPQTSNISQMCLNKLDHLEKIGKNSLTDNIKNISGLLFVCFQSDISLQFSTLQNTWADSRKFPREEQNGQSIYLDPLIGHPATKGKQTVPIMEEWQKWSKQWGNDKKVSSGFYGCVKVRGGEFFFTPSISFLKKISKN